MKIPERFTEYVDEDHFRVIGTATVRSRKPKKTQIVEAALAKLFELEEAGADYKYTYTICGVCDMEYRDPANAPFAYCPYCGSKRKKLIERSKRFAGQRERALYSVENGISTRKNGTAGNV